MTLPQDSLGHGEEFSGELTGKENSVVKVQAYTRKSSLSFNNKDATG